jgi:hypothetical protein
MKKDHMLYLVGKDLFGERNQRIRATDGVTKRQEVTDKRQGG